MVTKVTDAVIEGTSSALITPGPRSPVHVSCSLSSLYLPRKPFEWIFALGWWGYFKK